MSTHENESAIELLCLAAKAIGGWPRRTYGDMDENPHWNPLADSGEAMDLAIVLGLRIYTPRCKGFGSSCGNQIVISDDPYEQTRRAIVLAAADIGRKMGLRGGK